MSIAWNSQRVTFFCYRTMIFKIFFFKFIFKKIKLTWRRRQIFEQQVTKSKIIYQKNLLSETGGNCSNGIIALLGARWSLFCAFLQHSKKWKTCLSQGGKFLSGKPLVEDTLNWWTCWSHWSSILLRLIFSLLLEKRHQVKKTRSSLCWRKIF